MALRLSGMSMHLEQSLQRDIDRIRAKILEMAGRAGRALRRSLRAFLEQNRQLAYSIILQDQYIDELEKEIDRLCLEFLVRQQPAAGHLRFAYAAIKINAELERVGDYAENVARQTIKIHGLEASIPTEKYAGIAHTSIEMLREAVDAFVAQDANLARKTMAVEEHVNSLREEINKELVQGEKSGRIPLEAFTPLINIARRFERVSDQAKNICEEVLYMCTGEYAKHKGTDIFRILFLDDHNTCRSQMAEGIGNALNQPKLVFSSAGVEPRPLDETTIRFMQEKGIDVSHHSSKMAGQVPNLDSYQVIVALSELALERFPDTASKAVHLDWDVLDPSTVKGSESEVRAAYEATFQFIQTHIKDLVEAILDDDQQKSTKHTTHA